MNNKVLSIIIPVYNEEKTILKILCRISEIKLINSIEKEIIIVNDCSTDNSESLILEYIDNFLDFKIHYYRQNRNMGKGAALRKGFEIATGDYIIVQDAITNMILMNTISC